MMQRLALCLMLLAGPARADLEVRAAPGASDPWRIQVEGHRVSARQALAAIAEHLDWSVHASPQDLKQLGEFYLTLEIPDRHARSVLELIAASVGKEVDFDPDLRTILVSAEACPGTRSGRRALRDRAVRSYREAMLEPAHATDPIQIKSRLADLFMKEEDYVAAAKEWREIAETREGRQLPGDLFPRACLGAGLALEKAGKPADARQFYLQVTRDFRESEFMVEALLGASRCLYALGRAREGAAALRLYLTNERYFRAYIGARHEGALRLTLARGQFQAREFQEALATLRPVLEGSRIAASDRRQALLHAGLSALETGNTAEAAEWLGAHLRESPAVERAPEAWLGLAEALLPHGRFLEALSALSELDPASLEAPVLRRHALALSSVELALGRPGRAAIALERALGGLGGIAADPGLALALARVRQEQGNLEEARRLYQGLLAGPPGDPATEALLDEARIGAVITLARQGYHDDAAAAALTYLPGTATEAARAVLFQARIEALVRSGRSAEAAQEVLP